MRFVLFDTMSGAIVERTPYVATDKLTLAFDNAPENAVAVIKSGHVTHYTELKGGKCTIPTEGMLGTVLVSVKVFGKTVREWVCEEIALSEIEENKFLVAPNDSNLPQEFTRLRIEHQRVFDELKAANERISALERKIDEMMTGWALV
jgi:hypothetical protein